MESWLKVREQMSGGLGFCLTSDQTQEPRHSSKWGSSSGCAYIKSCPQSARVPNLWLFTLSVLFDSLWPHGWQHTRLPCPSPSPGAYSNSCPLSWWCHPTISSSVVPFSFCLQSFPASGSFPMSQLFASGNQSIGASASVLPMNIQGWFSLGWTGMISLQSKGLSRVFSTPQFKSINSSAVSLLYGPTLTSINVYWKNHNFDHSDLCQQSNVSAF